MMWIQVGENLAKILNIKLFDVFELSLIEFFNMVVYLKWKNKKIEAQYKNKK